MLTSSQTQVVERVLVEEDRQRTHLVVAVSGAHAYGFPSRDSDIDLKAVHVLSTEAFLGLSTPQLHAERMGTVDDVEIDYTSNEVQAALAGVLGGNGNYLERILGRILLRTSPELEQMQVLARHALSRRIHRHYHGFASNKVRELSEASPASVKHVLYVLRTALTGAHALRSGEIVADLMQLIDESGFADCRELVERKKQGEQVTLTEPERARWLKRVEPSLAMLDEARDHSPLAEEPRNQVEVQEWLIALRRRRLAP